MQKILQTRRHFFQRSAGRLGAMALAHLLRAERYVDPLAPHMPPAPATAKSVIFLFMPGGPSQIDLYDPKPELAKWQGN